MKNWKKQVQLLILAIILSLAVMPTLASAEIKEETSYVNYLALGDSLAAGLYYDNTLGVGYTDVIADEFAESGVNVWYSNDYAVPGYTSGDVLADLQDEQTGLQEEVAYADIITVNAGANDLLDELVVTEQGVTLDPAKVPAIIQGITQNLATTLGTIRTINPDVALYVMGYYNSFPYLPQEQQAALLPVLDAMNDAIQAVAAQTGGTYVATDVAMAQNVQANLPSPTNVHPGEAGYQVIAGEFWKVVEPAVASFGKTTGRIYGENRFDTAVEVSKQGWTTAETVVIARGDVYADALAGTTLAYDLGAPILLTGKTSLSDVTKREITRLQVKNVVILGGEGAISTEVEVPLNEIEGVELVTRIGGDDRFETATLIAEQIGVSNTAVVAYGYNYPDALAVASYAAKNGYPILFTKKDSLPVTTQNALEGVTDTYVLGGTGVINEDVFGELPGATRLSGQDRYETAAAIINEFQAPTTKAFVATGEDFADALAGSVLATKEDAPLLLTKKNDLPLDTAVLVWENGIKNFTVLGGNGAIDNEVLMWLAK